MSYSDALKSLDQTVLANAVDSTTSPLIITDNLQPDNPIIYANQAFLDLCGYDVDEIIGKNCRFLQGDDTDKKTVINIRKAVKGGQDIRVNLKNYRKDGKMFWNDLVISPIVDEKGVVTHFIGMQLDVTERVSYTEKLEKIQEKLQRSNQELEQFTYAASHDLQEPLRMVSSYLQLLKKRYSSSFGDEATVFFEFATEGAERMQSLIDDLLAISRVSTTSQRFKKAALDDVVARALFNLKLQIDEVEATITADDLPQVPMDANQMVQLLQNLISNAIKYRRKNTKPTIHISAETDKDVVTVTVKDNGIGIQPQYKDRIFVIFQRLHTREEYPGTGVGLALCSKIIERHHGKIWVESNGKDGSAFKFSLPLKRKATHS